MTTIYGWLTAAAALLRASWSDTEGPPEGAAEVVVLLQSRERLFSALLK